MFALLLLFFLQLCNNVHKLKQPSLSTFHWNDVVDEVCCSGFRVPLVWLGYGGVSAFAESRCCASSSSSSSSLFLRVSALSSLLPFPPRRRSLTPPYRLLAPFARETVTCSLAPRCWSQRSVFLPPWGTSRHPNPASLAGLSCAPFFQAKSLQPPGKACCSSQKW